MDVVWDIVFGLLSALVIGTLAHMLLRIGIGIVRTVVVSLISGFALWPVTLQAYRLLQVEHGSAQPLAGMSFPGILIFVLLLAWTVVISMFVLLATELVVPTGAASSAAAQATRLPGKIRQARRLGQIQWILVKFGLSRYLRPRLPRRLHLDTAEVARTVAGALAACGVTFVKLGQFAATRSDTLPLEFVKEFSKLQAEVPAVAYSEIEGELLRTWGKPPQQVFAQFDTTPLAAASVAQVHAAVRHDGSRVVVKVQRPRIRSQVQADSDIILTLAEKVEKRAGWAREVGLYRLVDAFVSTLRTELDYREEAAQTNAMRQLVRSDQDIDIAVPQVYSELSGRTVMVMDAVPGTPISKADTVLAALPNRIREQLADELFLTVARQMLVTGTFHADLHGGNILLTESGELGLIDFGAVGRLEAADRRDITILLVAFVQQDSRAATAAVLSMVGSPAGVNTRVLQRDIGDMMLRFANLAQGRYSELFAQLANFFVTHGFTMPTSIGSAFRAISTLEGSLKRLSPDLDLLGLVGDYGNQLLKEALHAHSPVERAKLYAMTNSSDILELPGQISRAVAHLEAGSLNVGPSGVDLFSVRRLTRFVTDRLTQVIVAAAMLVGGVLLMMADLGPELTEDFGIFTYFGSWLLLVGCSLGAIVVAPALRDRRG